LFRVNEEVVVYEDPDHAAESIAKLLENENGIQRIASQGQKRTHSEHTYAQRVQRMIEHFGPLR
jgi:spore maturation protein CgeB